MTEIFEQLSPFKWRDVEFPVTQMRISLAHDLVEHKYVGVDGARIEDTGLAPMRFEARIPFVNSIIPGPGEKWKRGTLYPRGFRDFLKAFANKKTGILQHPEFGELACKAEHVDVEWSGQRRGGCDVTASWVETIIDGDVSALDLPSPVAEVVLEAQNLDASNQDLKKLVPQLPEYEESFEDLARKVQAVGDQIALLQQRAAGKIDSIEYRIGKVQDSIDRAKNALTWPATQSIERMKSATHDLRQNLLASNRDIILLTVRAATTLAGLLPQLEGATLNDIIVLNPRLLILPVVPSGTIVRYYAPKVARAA